MEAVILYSSNDNKFAELCIQSLLDLGIKTHIITYSHMWNGTPENLEVLDNSLSSFVNNPLFCRYIVNWEAGQTPWYWEGLGRYLGTQEVSDSSEYIIYIDIDEIIDSEKFKLWIDTKEYRNFEAIKLATYWYWREPIYQATQLEDSVVMIKTTIAKQLEFQLGGRDIYFNSAKQTIRNVGAPDAMIHHYSWVRTKDEMIHKVKNWGHSNDKGNWLELIKEEFSRPFNGSDFLHNYQYNIVDNKFNIK